MKALSVDGSTGGIDRSWPSIRVFGGIGLQDADGPVSIGGPRQRRLLGLLALRADRVLDIDWLAEYLWDDEDRPDLTEPLLRTYVSRLRAAFPSRAREWVVTEPEGYRLDAPPDAIEHLRFGRLRASATQARERGDPQTAMHLLDQALDLWRGDPFRELGDLELAESEIERLQLDRLEMMEERWEAALALGRHTQITGELAAFASEHGERDRAVRQYALALHRSGQTTGALRVVREHRRVMVEEFGLDTSAEITHLEQALLDDDPALLVEKDGRPLRGYRLLEEIGMGSFAVVWRGIQPSVGREVAIKQIRAELATQPGFIRRFEAEAHLVARLEHPHIVPLIDYWRDPDSAFLVMRWLVGGTLERRLDDGPLAVDTAMVLAQQIGGALSAAHSRGVIHRDVKSANILFDEDDNAYLTDFGIALEGTDPSGPEAALSPGSPAYASPEQLRRETLGPASDVFSLGVVLFESLSGSLPFPADTPLDVLVGKQLTEPYPALTDVRPDIPEAVSAAIAKATAKDPASRFASVDAFVAALTADDVAAVAADTPTPRVVDAALEDLPNPYLGLLAFDDASADHFYGRDRLVGELLARLDGNGTASRCLVIVGPSGSGKSSVARAGLLPKLREGAVAGSADWFPTTMTPGDDPYESLEAALLRIAVNPPATLLDQLRDGRRGILRGIRRCLPSDGDRLLLLVDQTEELFLGRSAGDADEFLDALAVAVTDPTSPLRLAMTLRADYYQYPLEHPAFAPVLDAAIVNVTPLAGDELEQAIVEPARSLGVSFGPGLVARIAAETMGQPSPLPMLQYALTELFERRRGSTMTVEAYDEVGGLAGALTARAEAIYVEAEADERAAVRRVFGALADPAEASADLRRRVRLADLGDDPATSWVIDHFGAARLLVFDHDAASRDPTVEITHEALLREWPRLAAWLEADREVLRAAVALADAATRWGGGGRRDEDLLRGLRLEQAIELAGADPVRVRGLDSEYVSESRVSAEMADATERSRQRRVRILGASVALALVTVVVLGGLAVLQQTRADDEMRAAVAAQDRADLALLQRRATESEPRVGLLLALEAQRRDPGPESDDVLLAALRRAGGGRLVAAYPSLASGRCAAVAGSIVSRDGLTESSTVDGMLVTRDLVTGQTRERGPIPTDGCVRWFGDETTGRRYAYDQNSNPGVDGARLWLGRLDGPWEETVKRAWSSSVPGPHAFGPTRLLLEAPGTVSLVDSVAGRLVAPPLFGLAEEPRAQLSPDEGRFAVVASDLDTDGEIVIVHDARDGSEQARTAIPSSVTALAFDDERTQLLLAATDGHLRTVDLSDSAVVADVVIDGMQVEGPGSIGITADGLVTLISSGPDGGVQVIDRVSGQPRGPALELAESVGGRTRPDGTIVTWRSDHELDVIDPRSDPLVERMVSLAIGDAPLGDNEQIVTVNGQQATMLPTDEGVRPAVVDLSDGQGRFVSLHTPDGRHFPETRAYAAGEGLVAVTDDQRVGLWIDDVQIDEVVIESDRRGGLVGTRSNDPFLIVTLADGPMTIEDEHLLDLSNGRIEERFAVTGTPTVWIWPMSDGGLWRVGRDGLAERWDASGESLEEQSFTVPDAERISIFAADEHGRVAYVRADAPGGLDRIEVRDLERGETIERTAPGLVNWMGFARDGELLALQMVDGSVRLMDVESGLTGGVLWDGDGTQLRTPWYDQATDSIWVAAREQLVRLPIDPSAWREHACASVTRELTASEWAELVPGDEPQVPACPADA